MALCSGYFCDETMRQGTVAWSRRSCNQYFTVLVNGCHVSPLLPLLLLLVVHASIIISHNAECELLKKKTSHDVSILRQRRPGDRLVVITARYTFRR